METFVREYMLSHPSICDSLVELFRKAVAANLVLPGVVGPQAQVDPSWKRSTDLGIGIAEKHWNLREFRFDAYMQEVSGFINRYIAELLSHGGSFKMKYSPQIQVVQARRRLLRLAHRRRARSQRPRASAVKGNTVIFPAALTHVHRGVVSPTQHKYLLTGWLWWA
jgi:hypothetical protein